MADTIEFRNRSKIHLTKKSDIPKKRGITPFFLELVDLVMAIEKQLSTCRYCGVSYLDTTTLGQCPNCGAFIF